VKWSKNILIFAVVFMVVSMLFNARSCSQAGAQRPPDARVVPLTLEVERPAQAAAVSFAIQAEVADTPEKRARGMSGRRGPEPGYGMLYIYATPTKPKFSGASNRFPVTLAFLREDGTVAELVDMQPKDTRIIVPDEAVNYVLEVRQGWFQDRGVQAGVRFTLPDDLTRAQPRPAAALQAEQPAPENAAQ